jgi:hypothetical protein
MSMKNITMEEVEWALRDVVAEYGEEYIYVPPKDGLCRYLDKDPAGIKPACLVGHVLVRLGALVSELACQEGRSADALDYGRMGLSLSSEAINVLYMAQEVQDEGRPWGDALREALRVAEAIRARREVDAAGANS